MSKSLVLSLDNPTVLKEKDILLAGEWVLEENDLNRINYEIFFSSSDLKKERIKSSIETDKIFKNILLDISNELNRLHTIDLNLKSWSIILTPWLKQFVQICYQKDSLLEELIKKHKIKKIIGIKNKNYKLCSEDSYAIHPNSRDTLWNNIIFLKLIDYKNLKIELDFSEISNKFDTVEEYKKKVIYKKSLKKKIIEYFFFILKPFKKNNDALIIGSTLPFFFEKLLELSFFQVPQFYNNEKIIYAKYDNNFRSNLKLLASKKKVSSIESFIRKILPEYLPICFLESFKEIFKNCEKNFPKTPKFILSGYNQDFDEKFKFYAAKKTNEGIPYYLVQHGNTYFVEDFVKNRHEYETSKKFFTFGYEKENNFKKIGNLKLIGKKIIYKNDGNLNLLCPPMLGLFYPYDRNQEFIRSLELIREFEKKTKEEFKENIILRLHPNFSTSKGNWFKKKYFNNYKNNQIDFGTIEYKKFIENSRLNIFFYDSSGIYENLILGIPSIGIWSKEKKLLYNHINDEFIEDYELLRDANIIFENLDEANKHINSCWNDINSWWLADKTQKNIKRFNQRINLKANFYSLIKLRKEIVK